MPTTITLGAATSPEPPAPFAASRSVIVTVLCLLVVPHIIAATGVSAGFPAMSSFVAISFNLAAPISTTTTSDPPAIFAQSSLLFEPASWPVTTVTDDE